jgi:Skp family chaperone for outer membrane proteins
MAETLEALIEREYETVQKEREKLLAEQAKIDEQLRALDRRLEAAANYKATLEGKFAAPQRKARASSARAPRGARGELRQRILDLLRKNPDGLVSRQIGDALPDSKNQLPNVLSQMKGEGLLTQAAGRKTPYRAAAS